MDEELQRQLSALATPTLAVSREEATKKLAETDKAIQDLMAEKVAEDFSDLLPPEGVDHVDIVFKKLGLG